MHKNTTTLGRSELSHRMTASRVMAQSSLKHRDGGHHERANEPKEADQARGPEAGGSASPTWPSDRYPGRSGGKRPERVFVHLLTHSGHRSLQRLKGGMS